MTLRIRELEEDIQSLRSEIDSVEADCVKKEQEVTLEYFNKKS